MLRVEVHDASNTTWLRVEGRFVGAFAEDTKAMVVRCKLPSHLVVDLSGVVQWMSCAFHAARSQHDAIASYSVA